MRKLKLATSLKYGIINVKEMFAKIYCEILEKQKIEIWNLKGRMTHWMTWLFAVVHIILRISI